MSNHAIEVNQVGPSLSKGLKDQPAAAIKASYRPCFLSYIGRKDPVIVLVQISDELILIRFHKIEADAFEVT
jgi:hypothetical protein